MLVGCVWTAPLQHVEILKTTKISKDVMRLDFKIHAYSMAPSYCIRIDTRESDDAVFLAFRMVYRALVNHEQVYVHHRGKDVYVRDSHGRSLRIWPPVERVEE